MRKLFYNNDQRRIDHEKVLKKSPESAKETFEAKMRYILKMRNKPEDPNTAPKNELDYIKSITL